MQIRHGRWLGRWLGYAMCFSLAGGSMSAADKKNNKWMDRVLHVAHTSTLDQPGMSPWHLKIDVQLFNASGKPDGKASIEEWWASEDRSRITYMMPTSSVTVLHTAEGDFRTKEVTPEPPLLDAVLQQVVHPILEAESIEGARAQERDLKFGNVDLNCVMLTEPNETMENVEFGTFPTYCLYPGTDSLRMDAEVGAPTFMRNAIGTFQGQSVALDTRAVEHDVTQAEGHISLLTTMPESAMDLSPSDGMVRLASPRKPIRTALMKANVISQIQPEYPPVAKMRRDKGSVLMSIVIDEQGSVSSLHVMRAPAPDLGDAAATAVKQWRYRPYLVNGIPTPVQTVVVIHFAMLH